MNFLKKAMAICLSLLLVTGCSTGQKEEKANIVSSSRYIGQARGFFVSMQPEGDFPQTTTEVESQKRELDRMISFAEKNKLNTIFFEVKNGANVLYHSKYFAIDQRIHQQEKDTFDPLAYLCEKASQNKVQVLAVVDIFSANGANQETARKTFADLPVMNGYLDPSDDGVVKLAEKTVTELVKKYDIAGIVIEGMDLAFAGEKADGATAVQILENVGGAVKKASPTTVVAAAFDATAKHNALTPDIVQSMTEQPYIDMFIPILNTTVDKKEENNYLDLMKQWAEITWGEKLLYTGNYFLQDNPLELQNQLLANAVAMEISGTMLMNYTELLALNSTDMQIYASLLGTAKSTPLGQELAIPQTLGITYPQANTTVQDSAIYIMGTSDPALPLTMGGTVVERLGDKGTFGVAVKLAMGDNTIKFEQGGQSVQVTVTRKAPTVGSSVITQIPSGSLYPTTQLGVDANETIKFSITAPAGASVTASVGGKTVILNQSVATAKSGVPATFVGNLTLSPSDYDANKVTNIGKVTYVVMQNGNSVVQYSKGEILVAGTNVPLTLQIKPYIASMLNKADNDDDFTHSLKSGARATIVGKQITKRSGSSMTAYQLSSGEYILASNVEIVTDPAQCVAQITDIVPSSGEDWWQFDFLGGQPAVKSTQENDVLTLRFLNAKLPEDLSKLSGGIIKSVEQTATKDGVELKITCAEGELWGYDITHGDEITSLFLRKTPVLSTTYGKPLQGIRIMLDPGHGGENPGALGVAGVTGPTEAQLNDATAAMVRFRLEQMGANVIMTRDVGEPSIDLDERNFLAEKERPHLFISIHHNSTVLNKDLTNVRRMEVYYQEKIAEPLAQSLMTNLGVSLGRNTTEPENAYYYVTRLTFAPAVLFEMGFVVNPYEYEESCEESTLYKAANGVGMAVLEMLGR